MTTNDRVDRVRRWVIDHAALLALTFLAVILRYVGIGFGLPHRVARPDEQYVIMQALTILQTGSMEHFSYPGVFPSVFALLLGVYYAFGRVFGHFDSGADVAAEWTIDPTNIFLIARGLSAAVGALTVPAVYVLGRDLFGRTAGMIAAGFVCVAHLHVRDSHFATMDVSMTFACVVSLIVIERARVGGKLATYFWAALASGLAVSTKYNAAALAAPLAVACALGAGPSTMAARVKSTAQRIGACGVGGILGVVGGTPYMLWRFDRFLVDILDLTGDKLGGRPHAGIYAGSGYSYHSELSLWHGVGLPMLLMAGVGLGFLAWHRRVQALALVSFGALYAVMIGGSLTVFARYAMPLVPVVSLLAAAGLTLVSERWASTRSNATAVAAAVAVAAIPLYSSLKSDVLFARTDSRLLLAQWIREHVPSGSSLAFVGDHATHAELFSTPEQIEAARKWMIAKTGRGEGRAMTRLAQFAATGAEPTYLRLTTKPGTRFVDWYSRNPANVDAPDVIVVPTFPVYEQPYLTLGAGPWLDQLLRERYRIAHRLEPQSKDAKGVYEPQDVFFLPFAGFAGIERPGPGFVIYRRVDPRETS